MIVKHFSPWVLFVVLRSVERFEPIELHRFDLFNVRIGFDVGFDNMPNARLNWFSAQCFLLHRQRIFPSSSQEKSIISKDNNSKKLIGGVAVIIKR